MHSITILKLQLEDLQKQIVEYEEFDSLDKEERSQGHPAVEIYRNHQHMRAQARDRIVAITAAMASNARTIY